ncbi:MAG: YfhO family protein, partial [Acidobacteriota bacterium]|nr:YfhO family protein [Acidobacteriota bacterium]
IKDDAPVLRVTATDDQGGAQTLALRAGADTSEWAHDCADVLPVVAHRRAQVFESFKAERGAGVCEGHSYVARLRLDRPLDVKTLRLEWIGGAGSIDVKKISLLDGSTPQGATALGELSSRATPVNASERAADPSRWRQVGDAGGVSVLENLRAQPRAWIVGEVVTLPPDDALKAIKTSRLPDGRAFDPARTALVEEAFRPAPSAQSGPPDAVSIARETDTRLTLRVSARSDSFLVLSDVYYPGWRASVDGQGARVYQTDYALRGIFVAAGEHAVEFSYEPVSLRVGVLVSALSVGAVALVSLLLARRGRTPARSDPATRSAA